VVWRPWPTSASAPSHISSPQKPKTRGAIGEIFRRLCREENRERERKLCRGNSLPEGEIIAIVTIIELGFIGIIIIITSTIITIVTTPS
jgi:hypothetical protein